MKDLILCSSCIFYNISDAPACQSHCKGGNGISPIRDSKPEFIKFVEDHKNELMLDGFEVVQLLGFDEDTDDYYWKLYSMSANEEVYNSCCLRLMPLKNKLSQDEYETLEQQFNLNKQCQQEWKLKERQHQLEKELKEVNEQMKQYE